MDDNRKNSPCNIHRKNRCGIVNASGEEVLVGIEAIVTEAAKALAKALKVPHDMAHQTILMTLNENAGLSYENDCADFAMQNDDIDA